MPITLEELQPIKQMLTEANFPIKGGVDVITPENALTTLAGAAVWSAMALSRAEEEHESALSLARGTATASAPDPIIVDMVAEQFDTACESAIAAGVPAKAVEYFGNLFRDGSGNPTPFMLSRDCEIESNGKKKPASVATAVIHGLLSLARGGFGQGVPTGQARAITGPSDTQVRTDAEKKALRQLYNLPVTA